MENKKDKRNGLPNYFKKIGAGIVALTFIVAISIRLMDYQFDEGTKSILKIITFDFIIIGLLLITLAKDKIEDEMTLALKLKSMASGFIFAIIFTIIYPFINLALNEPLAEVSSSQLIMTILLVQIMSYYGLKKAESK